MHIHSQFHIISNNLCNASSDALDVFYRTDLPEAYPIQRVREFPFKDDAFGTVMNWLYAKIPETR